MPDGVMSKTHASTMTTGNPKMTRTISATITQFGKPSGANVISPSCKRMNATTAYAAISG